MKFGIQVALVLLFLTSVRPALAGQRRLPWTNDVPALAPGDRIRVWAWEYGPQLQPHRLLLGAHEVRIVGELLTFDPPNSLRLRPTGLLAPFSVIPERTVDWTRVSRIDTPNGRDVLRGAVGGVGVAFGLALLYGLGEHAEGCQEAHSCGSVWKRTLRYSVVTAPIGTVVGFLSTRWKRVY